MTANSRCYGGRDSACSPEIREVPRSFLEARQIFPPRTKERNATRKISRRYQPTSPTDKRLSCFSVAFPRISAKSPPLRLSKSLSNLYLKLYLRISKKLQTLDRSPVGKGLIPSNSILLIFAVDQQSDFISK